MSINIFGFLKEIGGDCAGAVALYAPGVKVHLGGEESLEEPELSPMYDSVSTLVYPDLSRDFAMSIGGEMFVDRIGRQHFVALAKECGMSSKLILSRLDALATRIEEVAERLAKQMEASCSCPIYQDVLKVIS